jgi:hypothetical protein
MLTVRMCGREGEAAERHSLLRVRQTKPEVRPASVGGLWPSHCLAFRRLGVKTSPLLPELSIKASEGQSQTFTGHYPFPSEADSPLVTREVKPKLCLA